MLITFEQVVECRSNVTDVTFIGLWKEESWLSLSS